MGNEAADLDSIVSAVSYAWYLHLSNISQSYFPFINIPKDDFKLRTEAVCLFKEAGINYNYLLYAEDVDLEKINNDGNLKLILVDHNKLAYSQSGLVNCIDTILDHHADENFYPDSAVTDIRPVGSASTIIAEFFFKDQNESVMGSLGTLLLGTILLDTVNLDPSAGRATDDDFKAVETLVEITDLDSEKLFKKLQFEKYNVSSFGSYDLLRKDYKEWQLGSVKLGIGSVLLSLEDWTEKDPDMPDKISRYSRERNLDVFLSMNAFRAPEFKKQLVVYIPDLKLKEKTIAFLEDSDLGMEKLEISLSSDSCVFYNQKNLKISRKKLQPLVKEFFEG